MVKRIFKGTFLEVKFNKQVQSLAFRGETETI